MEMDAPVVGNVGRKSYLSKYQQKAKKYILVENIPWLLGHLEKKEPHGVLNKDYFSKFVGVGGHSQKSDPQKAYS